MPDPTFPVKPLRQQASGMPWERYSPSPTPDLPDRTWPGRRITEAPRWLSTDLRDGNQALPEPMGVDRKSTVFDLLVRLGYKEIEVGFPAASESEFRFLRKLIENDGIPDDVVIQVITPAREELIRRTFAALDGVSRAVVHLYNSTSPTQRRVVFGMDRNGVEALAVDHARLCRELADRHPGRIGFEYSPESFSQTEPEFALQVCESVMDVWEPGEGREIILNLPSTVECTSPNHYADQVEWMSRGLSRREHVCLSLHPHNDRGTAVASAELGILAGADRVEGCLFGNGERTGNVCLVVLALNLMTQGIDPQIDFSDLPEVRRVMEDCTRLGVPERHPYAGDLVHTSFSGSHQDAINKGLRALSQEAGKSGTPLADQHWDVPYLPVDPQDIGRSYRAVIRVNSQSGKGGVDYLLQAHYGLSLPRGLQVEVSGLCQAVCDSAEREVGPEEIWSVFAERFLPETPGVSLVRHSTGSRAGGQTALKAEIGLGDGTSLTVEGAGTDALAAFADAWRSAGRHLEISEYADHPATLDGRTGTMAYVRCTTSSGGGWWGCAFDPDPTTAALQAACTALHRSGDAG